MKYMHNVIKYITMKKVPIDWMADVRFVDGGDGESICQKNILNQVKSLLVLLKHGK